MKLYESLVMGWQISSFSFNNKKKTMIYIRLACFNNYILNVVNDDLLPSFHQLHKEEITKPL